MDFESETFLVQSCVGVSPTLRAGGNQTGGNRPPGTDVDTCDSLIVQSVALRGREGGATAELGGDVANALRCGGGGGDKPHVLAPIADTLTSSWHNSNGATAGNNGGMINPVIHGWAVRRLTPRECERLQGFEDDYTLTPVKKSKRRSKKFQYVEIDGQLWQLSADGPRYKALGNSFAVPVVAWIGKRIQQAVEDLSHG